MFRQKDTVLTKNEPTDPDGNNRFTEPVCMKYTMRQNDNLNVYSHSRNWLISCTQCPMIHTASSKPMRRDFIAIWNLQIHFHFRMLKCTIFFEGKAQRELENSSSVEKYQKVFTHQSWGRCPQNALRMYCDIVQLIYKLNALHVQT